MLAHAPSSHVTVSVPPDTPVRVADGTTVNLTEGASVDFNDGAAISLPGGVTISSTGTTSVTLSAGEAAEESGAAAAAESPDEGECSIIRLNVGGVNYATTKATLGRFPDSLLGQMMSDEMTPQRDDTGAIFIDRNGELFGLILDLLRDVPDFHLSENFNDFERITNEAAYYGLREGRKMLEEMRMNREKKIMPPPPLPPQPPPTTGQGFNQGYLAEVTTYFGHCRVSGGALSRALGKNSEDFEVHLSKTRVDELFGDANGRLLHSSIALAGGSHVHKSTWFVPKSSLSFIKSRFPNECCIS